MALLSPTINKTLPAVLPRGKCILSEKPFVYSLKSKYRTERCDFCLSEEKVMKCSSCRYVYYCNRICQKDGWNFHKKECLFLQRISPKILPDAARMLSRIIFKLNNGGDYEKGYYTETKYRQFKDLMSHIDDLKTDTKRMEHIESLTGVLLEYLGEQNLPESNELLTIYGRMLVNSFNILDPEMNSIGTGMYLGASILDHRCKPNAVATFEGTTIYIRLLDELPILDWSKVFISYVDLITTIQQRRNDLLQNYYFLCSCSTCLDPMENRIMNSAACPNYKCHGYISILPTESNDEDGGDDDQSLKCTECNQIIPQDSVKQFNEIMELTKMHLEQMKDIAYLDVCKILLTKQANLFHDLNLFHVKTLDLAFESAINVGKWTDALDFGNKLISGFSKYSGEYNPLLGLLYMKIGKILLYLEQPKEAGQKLKKASDILSKTHGTNHSLYQSQLLPLICQVCDIKDRQ